LALSEEAAKDLPTRRLLVRINTRGIRQPGLKCRKPNIEHGTSNRELNINISTHQHISKSTAAIFVVAK
jgi:hypothetical protein